jgi:hypothetical protein
MNRGMNYGFLALLGYFLSSQAQETLRDSLFLQTNEGEISYHLEKPPSGSNQLKALYSPEQIALLEKLNRADIAHLPRAPVLVVPERWDPDELSYSPSPRKYVGVGQCSKILVLDLRSQVFGGYEAGRLVRWGPISSGRMDRPTPQGFFHLNWKSRGRYSTVNPTWYMRWYFNVDNVSGRAFHAYSLPGYPASHACIRLLERDARWLYQWGESWELGSKPGEIRKYGTPVLILGGYRFDEPPPWQSPARLGQEIPLPPSPVNTDCSGLRNSTLPESDLR